MTVLGRCHGYLELRVGLRGRELSAASGCRTALVRGTIARLGGACRMQHAGHRACWHVAS
jgi:hypothetical protein